ncbi:MAG TPA: CRTAC1 family protein [Bryobacteraceae bacterium]|nr:CRTAC1 family protein [Bryobacteraceae bacterium]
MNRRNFLFSALASAQPAPGFQLVDVTSRAGLAFRHNTGAFGAKYLPETMGPGCAFLDFDGDGWLDILLVNGQDWPGHVRGRTTPRLYRNNRNGSFTDVTKAAGLDVEMYGLGVAVADFDNDGFPDLYFTCAGQNRLFRNTGKGRFVDATNASGLGGRQSFSTSAMWVDVDRDGHLDLFVCNYVRWSAEQDVFCSLDGKAKSYCTPEAFRGTTSWLFRNRGDGTFEDITAKSGLFDASSKSLGVAMLDADADGWPDIFVANDTQPNKLYRNNHDRTFRETAVRSGVAFGEDGRARAGMGVDAGDFRRSGREAIAVTNFDNEMMGLFDTVANGFTDRAMATGVGAATRSRLGFGCLFFDADLDGHLDLLAVNGHIDDTVRNLNRGVVHAQSPNLFLNNGHGQFTDIAASAGAAFHAPKVGRGLALGDFDRDGDLDVLITTNGGPAFLYRNDIGNGNRSIRFLLEGRKSNRDAIGAVIRLFGSDGAQMRMIRGGSSYLSSSALTATFGAGKATSVERAVVYWPSGRTDEFKNLATGRTYHCVEGQAPRELDYR